MNTGIKKPQGALSAGLPLFGWAAAMLIVSSMPGDRIPPVGLWQWDKFAHAFEYSILAALLFRFCSIRWRIGGFRILPVCAGIIALFSVIDEFHQFLIPLRSCSWQDLVADNLGAWAGLVITNFIYKKAAIKWA
jgi:VanZ family protein